MITAQIEDYADCIEEMKLIYPEHWEALAPNRDKVPLDPDYELYLELNDIDRLLVATLREGKELIGYFIGLVAHGLHYKTCLTMTMDLFWVRPAFRNRELGAVKLFRCAEEEAKRLGVHQVVYGSKVKADASRLFEFLGCEQIEIHYSKWIGE